MQTETDGALVQVIRDSEDWKADTDGQAYYHDRWPAFNTDDDEL